jgi:N-formylglutamate deformylase
MSIFELTQADAPLVISVPHDGALIPDDIIQTMNPAVSGSSDRDYLISEVFEFEDMVYSKIKTNYSRHVIDLNRPATGESLYQNQTETELCPTSTFDFQDIYLPGQKPEETEIKRRIEYYWRPYHDKLAALIQTAKDKFGFCVLIDAHSIDDEVPRFFDGRLPDINVGTYAGQSCSPEIEQIVMQQLAAQDDFSFINNGRFKGGFITRNYGDPQNNVHAIQLEHAKTCYLNEKLELSSQAQELTEFWQQVLLRLL